MEIISSFRILYFRNGKELNKRAYAPGQHGQKRKKQTEYGLQLAEKQK